MRPRSSGYGSVLDQFHSPYILISEQARFIKRGFSEIWVNKDLSSRTVKNTLPSAGRWNQID